MHCLEQCTIRYCTPIRFHSAFSFLSSMHGQHDMTADSPTNLRGVSTQWTDCMHDWPWFHLISVDSNWAAAVLLFLSQVLHAWGHSVSLPLGFAYTVTNNYTEISPGQGNIFTAHIVINQSIMSWSNTIFRTAGRSLNELVTWTFQISYSPLLPWEQWMSQKLIYTIHSPTQTLLSSNPLH